MNEQYIPPSAQETMAISNAGTETLALADSLKNPVFMDKMESSWDAELEDASMQHIAKLEDRAMQLNREANANDGDFHIQAQKNDQIKKIRDTQIQTFGNQVPRFKDIQTMKKMYERSENEVVPVVGDGAREMAQHFTEEAEQYHAKEGVFVNEDALKGRRNVVDILMHSDDEPLNIPLDSIVSAGGFNSWDGRGNQDSFDKIEDYATRETDIPPVTELYGCILPNGKMIYMTANSHRVGAAKKKGDTTIAFKGRLSISKLNYFPDGTSPEDEVSSTTTANGKEIMHPREVMGSGEFQEMTAEYGLDGATPSERAEQLKNMNPQKIAYFLADVNRRVQGSEETLLSDELVNIGANSVIEPEKRYDAFIDAMDQISNSDNAINPHRVGDTLAMATVLLHPFKDGNGRTARLVGSIFTSAFDNAEEYPGDYANISRSQDKARRENSLGAKNLVISGYRPHFESSIDLSDPTNMKQYINDMLYSNKVDLYMSPYGQVPAKI